MSDPIVIETITALHADPAHDLVHIECATEDDTAQLDLRSGALSTLVLGLLQVGKALRTNLEEFSSQPLQLTGAGLIARDDGQLVLELVLDQMLRVAVDVPQAAIPGLQEQLSAMGRLRDVRAEPLSATQH